MRAEIDGSFKKIEDGLNSEELSKWITDTREQIAGLEGARFGKDKKRTQAQELKKQLGGKADEMYDEIGEALKKLRDFHWVHTSESGQKEGLKDMKLHTVTLLDKDRDEIKSKIEAVLLQIDNYWKDVNTKRDELLGKRRKKFEIK